MDTTQTETLFTWITCNGSECREALEVMSNPEQLRADLQYAFTDRGWDLGTQGYDFEESLAWLLSDECRDEITTYMEEDT